MNNKGQSLVLFIILLPIILLLVGMLIDFSYFSYYKSKVSSITRTIIANTLDTKEKDDIIKLYSDNNIEYKSLDINFDEGININITSEVKSIMIKSKSYKLNINIYGYKENDVIKYKKGSQYE